MRQLFGAVENVGFHSLCGLRAEPIRIRMRVLCPRLRSTVGGLCDIEAPIAELATLQLVPTVSLVVENLNTGIALPDIDGTVARAPWPDSRQIEQDLIICRAMCDLFAGRLLSGSE